MSSRSSVSFEAEANHSNSRSRSSSCSVDEVAEMKTSLAGLVNPKFWTQEELKKWVAQRKARFPRHDRKVEPPNEEEMSQIERKLRLKISILDDDRKKAQEWWHSRKFLLREATVQRARKRIKTFTASAVNSDEPPTLTTSTQEPYVPLLTLLKTPYSRLLEDLKMPPQKIEPPKIHDNNEIKEHLKERKKEDNLAFNIYLDDQLKNYGYTMMQNKLFAQLVIDDIHQEREYMLQIIRFLAEKIPGQNGPEPAKKEN